MTPIVEMKDVHVRFKAERTVHALNGVDVALKQGEVLGLLGESGSGKSVTLRALLRMLPAHRSEVSGTIRVAGEDVFTLDDDGLEKLRLRVTLLDHVDGRPHPKQGERVAVLGAPNRLARAR